MPDAYISPQGSGKTTMAYCIRPDGDCSMCDSYIERFDVCGQDEYFGGTGHGDESYSDADPGL